MLHLYFYTDTFLLIRFFVNIWLGKSSIIGSYLSFMDILCLNQVVKAHNADLHCVDWNAHDENLILTGYLSLGFGRYEPMKTLVFHVSYCRTLWTNCV